LGRDGGEGGDEGDEEPADVVFRGTGTGHGALETLSEMRPCGGT
jgi:hypothetical protein